MDNMGYAGVGMWQVFGSNETYNGMAVSDDGGASFNLIDCGNPDVGARYGAFPTPTAWYLALGNFPNTSATVGTPITHNIRAHMHSRNGVDLRFRAHADANTVHDDSQWA